MRPPSSLHRKTSTIWDEGAFHETTSILRSRRLATSTCYSERCCILSTCDERFGSNGEMSQSRSPLGSKAPAYPFANPFRSTSTNGHLQTCPVGPFGANGEPDWPGRGSAPLAVYPLPNRVLRRSNAPLAGARRPSHCRLKKVPARRTCRSAGHLSTPAVHHAGLHGFAAPDVGIPRQGDQKIAVRRPINAEPAIVLLKPPSSRYAEDVILRAPSRPFASRAASSCRPTRDQPSGFLVAAHVALRAEAIQIERLLARAVPFASERSISDRW